MKEENPRIRKELEVLEKNVEDKLLQLGWTMEKDEVADCANKEEEAMMIEDVVDVTTMDDELEIYQVGPRSCSLQTWMDDDISTIHTCVSFEHLVDEPHAGKRKISLLMQGSILPWMSMMRHCMEKQGLFTVAGLIGVFCDLMIEGIRAREKGGT